MRALPPRADAGRTRSARRRALAERSRGACRGRALLHISAVAVDGDERPVTNLKKEDLEVWIGGYRVPIES